MKKCSNCGKTYSDDVQFCYNCNNYLYVVPKPVVPKQTTSDEEKKTDIVKCPVCGSTQITAVQRKWGLVMGFMTNKVDRFCLNCKHKW